MNKIYIAIPSTDGNIFFELALRLTDWQLQTSIAVKIVYHPFLAPIDHARNVIVHDFLLTDCTHLMMVDDDIVPPYEALEHLLLHNKDIVAAACPLIGPNSHGELITTMNAYDLDKEGAYTIIESTGIRKVDAVGTGCMMIKRTVFETLRVPPFITEYNVDGIKYRGEDLNFCHQAKLEGFDTYVDFNIKCKHMKLCNLLKL